MKVIEMKFILGFSVASSYFSHKDLINDYIIKSLFIV